MTFFTRKRFPSLWKRETTSRKVGDPPYRDSDTEDEKWVFRWGRLFRVLSKITLIVSIIASLISFTVYSIVSAVQEERREKADVTMSKVCIYKHDRYHEAIVNYRSGRWVAYRRVSGDNSWISGTNQRPTAGERVAIDNIPRLQKLWGYGDCLHFQVGEDCGCL
jgi:hypothetical protein